MNKDLEIILRNAFKAGFKFRILKRDGGEGIDFNKWLKLQDKQVKNLSNVINQRELFDNFYKWLDAMTESEYDDMSLTEKIEKYFFKN